jgi:hypothetical protein
MINYLVRVRDADILSELTPRDKVIVHHHRDKGRDCSADQYNPTFVFGIACLILIPYDDSFSTF